MVPEKNHWEVLVITRDRRQDPQKFALTTHEGELKLRNWFPEQPPDATPSGDQFDLVISLGRNTSRTGDPSEPWQQSELQYLSNAIVEGAPVIGYCQGALHIASLFGAEIETSPPGKTRRSDQRKLPGVSTEMTFPSQENSIPSEIGRNCFDVDRKDHFVRRGEKAFAGIHLMIEVINGEGLDDQHRIETAMRNCVKECGATLLHMYTHRFSPQGVSGIAVLAESHISVHTWPEIGYGAFDIFMCGDAEPWRGIEVIRQAFNAGNVQAKEFLRGEGIVEACQ